MIFKKSQLWLKSQKGMYIMLKNMLMAVETVITSEIFCQINEDLVKKKTYGTTGMF